MLKRLLIYVVDPVVPESVSLSSRAEHHGNHFRCKTSTGKMQETITCPLSTLQRLLTFDTINRHLLWRVLCKFEYPPHFRDILREFHTDLSARVVQGGELSKGFVLTQE